MTMRSHANGIGVPIVSDTVINLFDVDFDFRANIA